MRFAIFTTVSYLSLMTSSAVMASDITVYKRDLYDRITIENAADGDVTQPGGQGGASVPYAEALSAADRQTVLENARTLSDIQSVGGVLSLSFNDAVTDTRHFRIGNRVILDVFYDADALLTQAIAPQPIAEVEQERLSQPEEVAPIESESIDTVEATPPPMQETETVSSNDALNVPTILTVSSTKPFGLAVFERMGRLFIVTDQADMAVPPQISGRGGELGWKMTSVPVDDGRAWMMPLPQGAYVRPEGRGLIWRLIISDVNPQLTTADIRRRLNDPMNPLIDILLPNTATLMRFTDPDYQDSLAVVTVSRANTRLMKSYDYVDFDILPAFIGAVIKPESDGVRLKSTADMVTISGAKGLVVAGDSQDEVVQAYLDSEGQKLNDFKKVEASLDRIYYFSDWGGNIEPNAYLERRQEFDRFLAMAPAEDKLSIVLDLVKLTLSQGMGQEALGYLKLAADLNPQINDTSEYVALRGAAHFLASQYDLAEDYLSSDLLSDIAETQLWHAATLASLGEEEKAIEAYNDNAILTTVYPYAIKRAVIAPLALAAINQDNGEDAMVFIDIIDKEEQELSAEDRATIAYLKGRAQSMTGRPDEAISNLYKASMGSKLGPYGIRSELLLIQDEMAREVIEAPEAIRRMERLRFAWRGDSLETEIYKALGDLYIENGQPRRGLAILKRAATNAETVRERRDIVRKMADAYKSIFVGERFETTDPMVTVAVYDEFKELTPIGEIGNQLIDRLADKLMSINMMSRATDVLRDKMDRLAEGQHAIQTGIRIAKIELLDREPDRAMETLLQVDDMLSKYSGEDKDAINSTMVLLKARAMADTGNPEQALFMTEGLDDTDEVIRLRIDTAWKTGNWIAVTDNLSKLLARENMTLSQPPTAQQAQLILNQAVALSLSNQYDALQRFAAQYDTLMKQTPNYKTFLVVTRPQNISNLADRETLLDVTSEVDLFQGVLEQEDLTE